MHVSTRDWWATVLTALVVLVYLATAQGWDVWLVGSSHRWAAGAIGLLGWVGCALGRPARGRLLTGILSVIGVAALAALVVALLTGSLAAVALLALATVVLWLVSTLRHLGTRTATHA